MARAGAAPPEVGWSLTGASYDSVSFSVTSQTESPTGVSFKSDGAKMYVCSNNPNTVFQYSLSTAWDVSSATYDAVSFDASGQDTGIQDIFFKADGTAFYLIGSSTDAVYQYDLTTAWDLSSASYATKSLSVSAQETGPTALCFNGDGDYLFIAGTVIDTVFGYTLSTAWDLSSASLDTGNSLLVTANPAAIAIKPDGTRLFAIGANFQRVEQHNLTIANDVSTGGSAAVTFSVSAQNSGPRGLAFSIDGTKMYYLGSNAANSRGTVYQYSTA